LLGALLLIGGVFVFTSRIDALPEKDIRLLVQNAESFEKAGKWTQARLIYESLLAQVDPGLNIRDRYQRVLRRCWQQQRHEDISYRKEVLSVDFGQALQVSRIINNTLLDGAYNKKKIDPTKLFKKGLEELETVLNDVNFKNTHIPGSKHASIGAFRNYLRKSASEAKGLTRAEMMERIAKIAMDAEDFLDMNPTVAIMEMACGACYAIDEYTVYLTPNQLRELTETLAQTDVDIGFKLAVLNNKIIAQFVNKDNPNSMLIADGDEILSVNMQPVANVNVAQVMEWLRGPAGTMVDLEVQSPTEDAARMIRLTRQPPQPTVAFGPVQGTPYFHLRITGFTEATMRDFDGYLKTPGMKGLILDLRQNGGGVVESAIEAAQKFLTHGVIASRVHQDSTKNFVYHAKNPNATSIPLVVLIDNDTASAAEILAGALKDNNRATLIGQTTFGKGCTQCILRIQDAAGGVPTGGMRLTVARFFSPKGIPYTGRGVTPHVFLDEQVFASQAADVAYLERAVAELNRVIASQK
jgi:carboxyl-terminal processing protease